MPGPQNAGLVGGSYYAGTLKPTPAKPAAPAAYTPPAPSQDNPTPPTDSGGGNDNWDTGIYEQEQAQAQRAYDQAVAGLNAKKAGIYNDYGFNPDGTVNGLSSTGKYQQLRHAQGQQLISAEDSRLARHLSAGGLGAQIEEEPRFQQEVDTANFLSAYKGELQGVDDGLLSAKDSLANALLQAKLDAINGAVGNQDYSPWDTPTDLGPSDLVPDWWSPLSAATAAQLTAARMQKGGDLYKAPLPKAAAPASKPVVSKQVLPQTKTAPAKPAVVKAAPKPAAKKKK